MGLHVPVRPSKIIKNPVRCHGLVNEAHADVGIPQFFWTPPISSMSHHVTSSVIQKFSRFPPRQLPGLFLEQVGMLLEEDTVTWHQAEALAPIVKTLHGFEKIGGNICVLCTHTHIYIYIYIYIHTCINQSMM